MAAAAEEEATVVEGWEEEEEATGLGVGWVTAVAAWGWEESRAKEVAMDRAAAVAAEAVKEAAAAAAWAVEAMAAVERVPQL